MKQLNVWECLFLSVCVHLLILALFPLALRFSAPSVSTGIWSVDLVEHAATDAAAFVQAGEPLPAVITPHAALPELPAAAPQPIGASQWATLPRPGGDSVASRYETAQEYLERLTREGHPAPGSTR